MKKPEDKETLLKTSTSSHMYSSNNPKISQHTRTQIWKQYNSDSNSKLKLELLLQKQGIKHQTPYEKLIKLSPLKFM